MAHVADYAKKGIHGGVRGGSKILSGFRDFLLRGNVVGWLCQLYISWNDSCACLHPGWAHHMCLEQPLMGPMRLGNVKLMLDMVLCHMLQWSKQIRL